LQYFPRNSSQGTEGTKIRPLQSVAEMRDQVTRILIGEYSVYRYNDWPAFDFLGECVQLTRGEETNARLAL
jgi:hypothetical protein